MFKWLHHLLQPHCHECEHDRACQSCDILREQVINLRDQNRYLLNKLIEPQSTTMPGQAVENLMPLTPKRYIPFDVKRATLEAEDRARARVEREMKETNKTTAKMTVDEIEKEMKLDIPS